MVVIGPECPLAAILGLVAWLGLALAFAIAAGGAVMLWQRDRIQRFDEAHDVFPQTLGRFNGRKWFRTWRYIVLPCVVVLIGVIGIVNVVATMVFG